VMTLFPQSLSLFPAETGVSAIDQVRSRTLGRLRELTWST
jgi:hypothetical protein